MRKLLASLVLLVGATIAGAADVPNGFAYSEIRYMQTPTGLTFDSITVLKPIVGVQGTFPVTYLKTETGPKLYIDGKAATAEELAAWSFARIDTRVFICENGNLYFSGGRLWQQTTQTPTCPNGRCPLR